MVNEPFKDKDGNIIEVPKRINAKTGLPSWKKQKAIPDAVQGPPKGRIIDDKPAGRQYRKISKKFADLLMHTSKRFQNTIGGIYGV